MKYILRVIHGTDDFGAEYILQPGTNVIGRSRDTDFRLKSRYISHRQCIIQLDENGIHLEGLSRYGTRVGSKNLHENETMDITAGEVIHIGDDTDIQLYAEDIDDTNTRPPEASKDSVVRLSEASSKAYSIADEETSLDSSTSSSTGDATIPPPSASKPPKTSGNETDMTGYTLPPDKRPAEDDRDNESTGYTRPPRKNSRLEEDNSDETQPSSRKKDDDDGGTTTGYTHLPPRKASDENDDDDEETDYQQDDLDVLPEGYEDDDDDTKLSPEGNTASGSASISDDEGRSYGSDTPIEVVADDDSISDMGNGETASADGTISVEVGGTLSAGGAKSSGATKTGDNTVTVDANATMTDDGTQTRSNANAGHTQFMDKEQRKKLLKQKKDRARQKKLVLWGGLIFVLLFLLIVKSQVFKAPFTEKTLNLPLKPQKAAITNKKETDGESQPQREPDFKQIPAFTDSKKEVSTSNEASPADEKTGKGDAPLFYILCPNSPKWSFALENKDYQVIHTYLGRKFDVPLNMFLSREQDNNILIEDFEDTVSQTKKKLEVQLELAFKPMSDSLSHLIPEGGGALNGLRCWQMAFTRTEKSDSTAAASTAKADDSQETAQRAQGQTKRSWYGIVHIFRNENMIYILRVEVPGFKEEQAEQLLLSNTFLLFPSYKEIGQFMDENSFIALSWDGRKSFKAEVEKYKNMRTNEGSQYMKKELERLQSYFKQKDPLLYAEQESRLKQFMSIALYHDYQENYKTAFDIFKEIRKKQRLYYNKLRISWLQSTGTIKETEIHKQIRNDAELVFKMQEDARYGKIRRDEWDK